MLLESIAMPQARPPPAALQTPPFSTWPNFPSWAPWLRGWEDQFSVPLLITLCI